MSLPLKFKKWRVVHTKETKIEAGCMMQVEVLTLNGLEKGSSNDPVEPRPPGNYLTAGSLSWNATT
jgi:hypothetical protein